MLQAQPVAIGQWRDHLPYYGGKTLLAAGDKIYCSSDPGMFSFDLDDNSITRLWKGSGLSDVGVNSIGYSSTYNTVVLGYSNGNIDLIVGDKIINLADIKMSNILGDRSINHVRVNGQWAYLSCGFAIVVLDLAKREIKDTYRIGNNSTNVFVNELEIYHDTIFAATKDGIYLADLNNPNLSDFQNWTVLTSLPSGSYNSIVAVNDKLYTNFDKANATNQDTIFEFSNGVWSKSNLGVYYTNNDVLDINAGTKGLLIASTVKAWVLNADLSLDKEIVQFYVDGFPGWATDAHPVEIIENNGEYFVCDWRYGLHRVNGVSLPQAIIPNGPYAKDVWELKARNGHLWVATGGYDNAINPRFSIVGTYMFDGSFWHTYNSVTTPGLDTIYDHISVTPDATGKLAYYGSLNTGGFSLAENGIQNVYKLTNTSFNAYSGKNVMLSDFEFDANGKLWALNSGRDGFPISSTLHVLKGNTWQPFTIPAITSNASIMMKMMIDSQGNKWIVKTKTNFGVVVAREKDNNLNSSTLFNVRHLSDGVGSGSLPSLRVNEMAEDHAGKIWFATDQGVAVLYSTDNLYTASAVDASLVTITDPATKVAYHLLATERVTCVAVDGGDRKWFGTDGSGVYLVSAEGTTQLLHFTEENSPLISNKIIDIAIDDVTGEVFIGTEKGIVSYRGTSTEGTDANGFVYAFPNPVKPDYDGIIGIRNLVNNAYVKITDITGNMVYETKAEGGQATWDGKRKDGSRPQTGVYLVFISNGDGTETEVTKILFIN